MYQPSDDSFLFSDFLNDYFSKLKSREISYLDLGTGSGILAEVAKKNKVKDILATDIDKAVLTFVKKKGFTTRKSNLFEKIPENFDLITFNAPYLPEDELEPKDSQVATKGGKKGDEISLEFIKQAKKHLNKNGKIFLLVSSLTPLSRLKKFKFKVVARKKIWMEELLILEF